MGSSTMRKFPVTMQVLSVIWLSAAKGQLLEEVRVFSFEKGLYTPPRTDIFIRYNFSQTTEPLFDFSICYRIKFASFLPFNLHMSYASAEDNTNALLLYNNANSIECWMNNQIQTKAIGIDWNGLPNVWHHICHLFNENTYTIYWQGQEHFKGDLEGKLPLGMNGILIIGQEQDAYSGGFDSGQTFRGDITQIDLWDRQLTLSEASDLALCRSSAVGNVFSSSEADAEVFGPVEDTYVTLEDICRPQPNYVIFPEERSFAAATDHCRLFKSSTAVPTSPKENDILLEDMFLFNDSCTPSGPMIFWVGITDALENGVWRNAVTQDIATYLKFTDFNPVNSTYLNCATMMTSGFWTVRSCDGFLKLCMSCQFRKSDFLYLRGLCFGKEHESKFHLLGYVNGRPLFRGYYDYIIMWEDTSLRWLLRNTATNLTVAWMQASEDTYPLGRHEWYLEQGLCGHDSHGLLNLILSGCSSDQFMCNSGICISSSFRCNLLFDCDDKSDEDGCSMVALQDGYRHHWPPIDQEGNPLMLMPSIDITRITSVDELNQAVTLEFELEIVWNDNRLDFKYLAGSEQESILSKADLGKIWQPEFWMTNLDGGRLKELYKTGLVRGANFSIPGFNSFDMDPIYPGSKNEIVLNQGFVASITCAFELYSFPFDTQICSIGVSIPAHYKNYVEFETGDYEVKYSGQKELSLFTVKNAAVSTTSTGGQLLVTFELQRRQGVILISTFLPSVLLLFVSWGTLFVKLEALNVRAVMSLTTLLVLYTLFAQLSNSLPKTASIKLIDIWFCFIILLLFSNIMVHLFAESIGKATTTAEKSVDVPRKLPFVAWNMKFPKPLSKKILMWQRWFMVPFAFIIFNVFFWWQIFQH